MKKEDWKPRFIQALRNSANVRAAAQAAGIERGAAYKARHKSAKFAAEWDQAIEEAVDTLEAAAWMRARDGVKRIEPLMYQGQKVGEKIITEYSDTLMVTLLKAHRPSKYKDRVEVTVKERAESAISEYMQEVGCDRRTAIDALRQHIPAIAELASTLIQ